MAWARASTPVAMSERCCPALPVGGSQPPHLPDRDAQQLSRFGVEERSGFEVVEHQQTPLFRLIQGDPVLHERTNSQNSCFRAFGLLAPPRPQRDW
jgi:hypothetical protein